MCIKFNGCEKLQMKTWKKRSFDVYVYLSKDIVNLYFLSSKKMVVYIGIIHESWWKLLDHYYLSLLCLPLGLFLVYNFKSSFFRHFSFSFPTITLRAWSVPELFHWVQFDTWQLRGQVSRTRTEACKALTNSFVGNKKNDGTTTKCYWKAQDTRASTIHQFRQFSYLILLSFAQSLSNYT